MKILFVTTISDTLNAFLIPHVRMLKEQGHKVDLACNIISNISRSFIEMGCGVYQVPFSREPISRDNIRAYKEMKAIVTKGNYYLIHTHTPVASFIARLACKEAKDTKVIYTAHGFHFYKGAPIKNWVIYYLIEKYMSKYTHSIITINNEDFQIAKERFHCKNVYLVNGVGIDITKFNPVIPSHRKSLRKIYNIRKGDFVIINVGELNYNKNQELLIRVISVLKKDIPAIRLLLVGEGELIDYNKELTQYLKLEDEVKFIGFRKDINSLLKISDLYVSTSKREGLPVSVMEAMATGLPLVVTNCRGNRDLVANGKNGIVVQGDTVGEIVSSIKEIYKDKELRNNFFDYSMYIINNYSIDNILIDMQRVYSKVTEN